MPTKRKRETLVQQVGSRMREVRLARGLTQADVAEAAGCDPQTIQRAESGRFGLSLNRLESVAKGLGVGIEELFRDVGGDVPDAPWATDESAAAAAWRRVPAHYREAALKMLRGLAAR